MNDMVFFVKFVFEAVLPQSIFYMASLIIISAFGDSFDASWNLYLILVLWFPFVIIFGTRFWIFLGDRLFKQVSLELQEKVK